MTPKHTPTPWATHGDLGTLIGADDGRMMLAEALHDHPVIEWRRSLAEAQANAELIVRAVNERPGLLETVDSVTEDLHAARTDLFQVCRRRDELRDQLDEARAQIVGLERERDERLALPPNTARRELADRIELFEAECDEAQYTDTGEAWDLLNEAAEALRVAAQDDGAYDLLREVYDRTQDPADGTCLEADIYERVNSLINDRR